MVLVQQSQRRQLVEWTTDLRHLGSTEFEWFVGELLRRDGWKVEEVGQAGSPDGGIDLVIRRGNQKALVQCKRWASWDIGVEHIRSFAGVIMRESASSRDSVFVTLGQFTPQAVEEAERLGMTLWDGRDLFARSEKARRHEPCPSCGEPMLLDRSPRGWWFRCVAAGCTGKRDLGRAPADAVGLLTIPPD
jgi:restriction system protein